jgi:hypothetical protein
MARKRNALGGDMRSSLCWLRRPIAGGLVFLLALPLAEEAAASPRQALLDPQQSVSNVQNQSKDSDSQAVSPGTSTSSSQGAYPDSPDPKPMQAAGQSGQSGSPQSGSEPPQNSAPNPVGTAAAPVMKSGGVAASRPAGAVIAPGKQRRARSILIMVGVAVGAAVAVGTVVALSHASPSRPN